MVEALLFWIFAALIVATAVGVVVAKNPIYSAMSLVGTFFFLAGEYVLLRAHLVAALQVLVYAGAIMVLFVFVIMLLSLTPEELGVSKRTAFKAVGGLAAACLAGLIAWAAGAGAGVAQGSQVGGVKAVARVLYTEHVLAFELAGVLLLVAIVGAVVVAKRRI